VNEGVSSFEGGCENRDKEETAGLSWGMCKKGEGATKSGVSHCAMMTQMTWMIDEIDENEDAEYETYCSNSFCGNFR
jgi:hypothetical protein